MIVNLEKLQKTGSNMVIAGAALLTAAAGLSAYDYVAQAQTTTAKPAASSSSSWTRVAHPDQTQSTDYNCVPASYSMSLASQGVKVSQARMAKLQKTTELGTTKDNAVGPYNKLQPKNLTLGIWWVKDQAQMRYNLYYDLSR